MKHVINALQASWNFAEISNNLRMLHPLLLVWNDHEQKNLLAGLISDFDFLNVDGHQ